MMVYKESSVPGNTALLQKGKYVFTGELKEEQLEGSIVPFFSAKAIAVKDNGAAYTGSIETLNISDLILKQSTYIDENGRAIEAHKLYTWPRNLGSTPAWTAAKQEFLNQFVLNFPVEVISVQESNGLTWRFITPENFKKLPEDLVATAEFTEYASHQNEYFFLRQPINNPK